MQDIDAHETIEVDPTIDTKNLYKIISGCIVPRPIALISTISSAGIRNAAPFSFFNGISDVPPMVCVSISTNLLTGDRKDTLSNISETREFVINVVDEELVEAEDFCARSFPPNVDEISLAGLSVLPSKRIGAPRIAESPVHFECRLVQSLELPRSVYTLVIGEIVYIHLRKSLVADNDRINPDELRAVGRMAGFTYVRTNSLFAIERNLASVVRGAGVDK